jgi:60 kDa SS-A/Ro ribonucleoprotein
MRFNFLKSTNANVVNHEGAASFVITPEVELYTAVATSGLSDTFYEKSDVRLYRIQSLIAKNDPEFVAKLAVYARNEMYLRSIPIVLAVELAKLNSGNAIVSNAVKGVVKRADEIAELLAYYQLSNQRFGTKKLNKLSKQVQKGLAISFNNFDEYQFAKYNRNTEVTLRDALFLVHPKAKNENQQLIFNKLAKGMLTTPYTWETELSAIGQANFKNEMERKLAIKNTWESLIDSNRLGYMALLRNLRNIIEANVSASHIDQVCAVLSDKEAVMRAKQLPFRFLSAYRELKDMKSEYISMILNALEDAVSASISNLKGFASETRVLVACDVSGSMQNPVSPKSKILMYDIGLVLGMLLHSTCKRVVTGMFGDTWKIINVPTRGVLNNVNEFYKREGEVGYSTNGYKVIDDLVSRKVVMDKIMIFTDCQLWDSQADGNSLSISWNKYKTIAPNAKLYLFDLSGYGQIPIDIRSNDVYLIAGWSDKVFDIMHAIDNGKSAIEVIHQIKL